MTQRKKPFPLPQKRLSTHKCISNLILGRLEISITRQRLLSWNKEKL